jgi:hypothetical protein
MVRMVYTSLALTLLVATTGCARVDDLWNAAPRTGQNQRPDGDAEVVSVGLLSDASMVNDGTDVFVLADTMNRAEVRSTTTDAAVDVHNTDVLALRDGNVSDAVADTRPTITALALRTGVVEAPNSNARWIGYVRAGGKAVIVRGPVGNDGCPQRREVAGSGWYEVLGGGYMCVGNLAALTSALETRGGRRAPAQPELDAAMPFLYGITHRSAAMYRWAPSSEDERVVEPERFVEAQPNTDAAVTTVDASLEDVSVTAPALPEEPPRIEELAGDGNTPLLRRMLPRMYVSLDRVVRASSGGNYWHTQSGGYVRTSALGTFHTGPTFQGVRLEGGVHLPVAFAISAITPTYTQAGNVMRPTGRAPRLQFFQLTGDAPVRLGTEEYYRTADGMFVRSRNVRVVTVHEPPTDLTPGEKWIDVNLDHQSLVAYEGTTPVYVTVTSTGLRRRSATENYETVQGGFRIQSKHVATTMDGNSNDGPYSIEDVPWVMYFEQSFALHGAFWHNGFGMVHSHGCVNLSPPDARWVFNWTEPRLPEGWHATYATATAPGTRVYVHYDAQILGQHGGPAHIPTH